MKNRPIRVSLSTPLGDQEGIVGEHTFIVLDGFQSEIEEAREEDIPGDGIKKKRHGRGETILPGVELSFCDHRDGAASSGALLSSVLFLR